MVLRRACACLLAVGLLVTGCGREADLHRAGGPDASTHGDPVAAGAEPGTAAAEPAFARLVPARTRQVVRTVSSRRWCREPHCTLTQAWARRDGDWHLVREFRSTIAPRGWGKESQGDLGTPEGVFEVKVTFSTTRTSPGPMPWRRRLPTSNVTDEPGRLYNTWLEERGRTDGDRPSMRWGFVLDYNHVRLRPGAGPAPVQGAGSGIFYHTSRPGHRWAPSVGCTAVGDPADMRWLLTWLDPAAEPRVVQNR